MAATWSSCRAGLAPERLAESALVRAGNENGAGP
jgi:hypothetical protein